MTLNCETLMTASRIERPCREILSDYRAGQSLTTESSTRAGAGFCTWYRDPGMLLGEERMEGSTVEGNLQILVDGKLNLSHQHALAAKSASRTLRYVRHSTANSQTWGLNFAHFHVEPGLGLDDPCEFLPTHDIL